MRTCVCAYRCLAGRRETADPVRIFACRQVHTHCAVDMLPHPSLPATTPSNTQPLSHSICITPIHPHKNTHSLAHIHSHTYTYRLHASIQSTSPLHPGTLRLLLLHPFYLCLRVR